MTLRVISTSNAVKSASKEVKARTLEVMLRDKMLLERFNVRKMIRYVYDDIDERSLFKRSGVDHTNKIVLVAVRYVDDDSTIRMPLFSQDSFKEFVQSSIDSGDDILDLRKYPKDKKDEFYEAVQTLVHEITELA